VSKGNYNLWGGFMRKTVYLLVVILLLIPLLSACNKSNNSTEAKTVKIKKLIDKGTQGWVWKEKEITKPSDVEQVLNKLKSLNLKDIGQEQVLGSGLIVEYTDDKDYRYVFLGSRVNINGRYYGITSKEDEDMNKLYDSLVYKEKSSKP
jgi:hypothetical protein